jgi:tetratricopeptide (TPR) repeat protein
MGEYAQAREAFKKTMDMETTPSETFISEDMIGQSYIYEGKYSSALQSTDDLLEKTPASEFPTRVAHLYDAKCQIHLETGELDKAEQSLADCRTVIQNSDLIDTVKENWAQYILREEIRIALHRKAFDTAMELVEQYKTMANPENNPRDMKRVHRLMGMIHLEQGDYATAIDHLQQADMDHPFDLYHLGVAESKFGNETKAKDLFSKVANWNEHSVRYAFVRPKAMAMLK